MSDIQLAAKKVGSKENKALMILSALGILFVVDEHLGRPISFFTQVFPYDSFYMPMFVFISGYFFRPDHSESWAKTLRFTWNRCKKSLLPYFLWVLFYFAFTHILRSFGVITFGGISLKKLVLYMISNGAPPLYIEPAWFVPMLFSVGVLYCCIRRIFRKVWNDTAATVLLVLLGAAAVYAARTDFNAPYHYYLLKAAFFMQFYHLGYFFRAHLEIHFDRANGFALCLATVGINLLLIAVYGDHIRFPYCARMGGFSTNNLLLPLITSVTGIAFWLKISKAFTPVLGGSKLVNFISDNTFFIMIHHLAVKALFTGLLIVGKKLGIASLASVDAERFKASAWYIFGDSPWIKVLCFLFTFAVTLAACKLFLCIKKPIMNFIKKRLQRRAQSL